MLNKPEIKSRTYHGNLTPQDIARTLLAFYNRGNYRAQQFGEKEKIVVQISTRDAPASGGTTALTIELHKSGDATVIQMGQQAWLGIAASLGLTTLTAWRNPWNLLSRLDDIAQDIENLKLSDQVWQVIDDAARAVGAGFELSERLRRMVCPYCDTANPVGEASCLACGAPMGKAQPKTCMKCGFVVRAAETTCPNCQARLS